MDGQRFDEFTRGLARGVSRRQVLRGLAGTAFGGALVGLGVTRPNGASASAPPGTGTCVHAGGSCSTSSDCCEGSCSTDTNICYCTDESRPALGCSCVSGVQNSCGDTTLICCSSSGTPGGQGTCTSASVGCSPTGSCAYAGDSCSSDSDCCEGSCGADTHTCYCTDESRPALGCGCNSGTQNPCGDSTLICCTPAGTSPGGHGTCTSASVGCNPTGGGQANPPSTCVFAGDACTQDSDCCEGSCGADTKTCYCTDESIPALGCGCNSGVENPCGDANLVCCTAAGTPPGGHGTCAKASVGCTTGGGQANPPVTTLPNTGSGPSGGKSGLLTSATLIGAGAALAGHRLRKRHAEAESADS